jgi:hypothetical protein
MLLGSRFLPIDKLCPRIKARNSKKFLWSLVLLTNFLAWFIFCFYFHNSCLNWDYLGSNKFELSWNFIAICLRLSLWYLIITLYWTKSIKKILRSHLLKTLYFIINFGFVELLFMIFRLIFWRNKLSIFDF